MRLSSCTFHNMGPFPDWTLDLEALNPDHKLIALVGLNGRGKSFSLEAAIAGASYRKMPTNGTLVRRATARDSWLESKVHYGQPWVLRHIVDAVTGKSEALVKDAAGNAAYDDTKVSSFDAWAALHLPDEDVLFSSLFAAQQSEGFVKMGSAERIDVILKVIGVARLERMAKAARARRDKASADLAALTVRITDARGGTPELEAAQSAVGAAELACGDAEQALDAAKTALVTAEAEDRRVAELASAYAREVERYTKWHSEWSASVETTRKQVSDLDTRARNNRNVLSDAARIRAAAARIPEIDDLLASLNSELSASRERLAVASGELETARERLAAARRERREAESRSQRLGDRLADASKVEAAESRQLALAVQLEQARKEVSEAEVEHSLLQELRVAGADERLTCLRRGLTMIIDLDQEGDTGAAAHIASNHIDADDESARLAVELPGKLRAADERLRSARGALLTGERDLSDAQRLAARVPEMAAARIELDEVRAAIAEISGRESAADELATDRHRGCGPLRAASARLDSEIATLQAERSSLAPVAAGSEPLAKAEARLAELEPQLSAARADLARLEESATPAPTVPPAAPDVAVCRAAANGAEQVARDAHIALALARQQLADAVTVDERISGLLLEREQLESDLSDWTRLALDLGRSGLQSAEVDSAGPEITELVNDLLRTCHGPRFTVSVDTQRLDSKGHKMLDECRIQVIDTVAGTEKEIREHSGGERALLGTAVSLALTMLACRRAGFDRPTIVRDESGANLDVENAPAWIAMLRRAIDVTGADKLIFVDHRPEIIAMADAVIEIPSFREAA